MPPPVLLVMACLLAADVLWWRRADPAGPTPAARPGPLPPTTAALAAPAGEAATRRQFLGRLVTVSPALLTAAGAAYCRTQLREFRIRPISVALPSLPPELDGLE